MVSRNPVGWIGENRALAAATALSLILAVAGVAAVATRGGDDLPTGITDPTRPDRSTTGADDGAPATDEETGAADGGGAATDAPSRSRATVSGPAPGAPVIPGAVPPPPCTPKPTDATGVTDSEIVIGQIVTDVTQVPQQLGPAHEGLAAYVELANASGGVCGRKLRLEYRNDNLNPATHRGAYESLARTVFAFVANQSLLDSQDYEQSPPFNPTYRDGDEYVPDVGGLAFAYNRSQSPWHAGIVGSLSPVLIGGGQVRGFLEDARSRGTPCRRGAVVYLREPTGASEDQARLLDVALRREWGGNLGDGNTEMYAANLLDPVPAYEAMVEQMVTDGMNCVFSYTDLASSINLVRAMTNRQLWPPDRCTRGDECFRVTYVPLSVYDQKFIQDGGEGALGVNTFIPHVPLNERDHPSMRVYLNALKKAFPDARPSTFSLLGFASGQMLVEALQACGGAPTRICVMTHLRKLRDFTSGDLIGAISPFRSSRATYGQYGTYDWKWVFTCSVGLRVEERNGVRDFHRIRPSSGFFCDKMKVARGTPG